MNGTRVPLRRLQQVKSVLLQKKLPNPGNHPPAAKHVQTCVHSFSRGDTTAPMAARNSPPAGSREKGQVRKELKQCGDRLDVLEGWNTWLNNKMRIAVFALSGATFWTTFGVGLSTNKYQEANFVKGRQQPWRSQCVPNSPGTQTKKKPNKRHKNAVRASGPYPPTQHARPLRNDLYLRDWWNGPGRTGLAPSIWFWSLESLAALCVIWCVKSAIGPFLSFPKWTMPQPRVCKFTPTEAHSKGKEKAKGRQRVKGKARVAEAKGNKHKTMTKARPFGQSHRMTQVRQL